MAGARRASVSCPVSEAELLQKLEAFAGAQDAVDELRRRGLLANGADGFLTLTDAGHVAHGRAAAGAVKYRPALPGGPAPVGPGLCDVAAPGHRAPLATPRSGSVDEQQLAVLGGALPHPPAQRSGE